MRLLALTAFLSVSLVAPVMAAESTERLEGLEIPTAEDATLADCQVWLDEAGQLASAEPPVGEDVLAEAEEQIDEAARACDEGNYHEGIVAAASVIDMLEEDAGAGDGGAGDEDGNG